MGGTTGAIFTCPLEVVKTRLQSTDSGFGSASKPPPSKPEILASKPAMGPTSNSNNSGSIRNSIFHPEVARGHMQITVPVANLHSKSAAHSTLFDYLLLQKIEQYILQKNAPKLQKLSRIFQMSLLHIFDP